MKFAGVMSLFMLVMGFVTYNQYWFVFALPPMLILGTIALFNTQHLWYMGIFAMPISINLSDIMEGAGLTFPTDLVCLGLIYLLILKMIHERTWYFHFYNHPIFLLVAGYFIWLLICSTASEMPGVSFKFTISLMWLFGGFYVMSMLVFRKMQNMVYFFVLIGIAFSLVMVVIMGLYVSTGRNPFLLRFNPMPFFVDHTVFGAFTATLVPMFALLSFHKGFSRTFRWVLKGVLLFTLMGLFFSYSRGAWLSMALGMGLMGLWVARVWVRKLIIPITVLLGIGVYFFIANYEQGALSNQAVSRKNLYDHLRSATNFKSDDSNAERINRWDCAIHMWQDRPMFGYGPGTYAFIYGDYQRAWNRTFISTNHADNGTAHNEVLLALSESGLIGAIFIGLIFLIPIIIALRGHARARNPYHKVLYLGCAFGLIVYGLHSIVNNFMDQDKIGGLIFGMLAIISALGLYHKHSEQDMTVE